MFFRYFIGSSICFLVFIFLLQVSSLFDFYSLTFYGLPLVYMTTLLTTAMYWLIKRYVTHWSYVWHCIIFGIVVSVLFGRFFFEHPLKDWFVEPIAYYIIMAAVVFSLGKFIPYRTALTPVLFLPVVIGLCTLLYPMFVG
ncbi:hypothetical protein [Priestia koreensis]|uniref:hypothetical protein n=1 Tax=Priestia koreensis TaxID=284581 RepID=UPI001F5A0BDA|nr:hypothetical protein [Priestia koreensis]UNL83438.1 hypothetical protein IE339_14820 [Priestia koreensis]